MYVSCDACGYDSGDCPDNQSLADKVQADGDYMEMRYDEYGKPKGWDVTCPKGHSDDDVRID